jgi:hypothetical protein
MSPIQALNSRPARLMLPLLLVGVIGVLAAAPASAQYLAVKLWSDRGDGAVYKPGEPINVSVRTNHDAQVLVYEIDAEGSVHLLFPTEDEATDVQGGVTLQLPEDPSEQLVVEGPVGQGYIVAIASEEPFRELPWYLRPRDVRAEEMGYTSADNQDDGVTPEGKIVGDPFVAMERIRRQVLDDPSDVHSFSTAYTSYYVHHEVLYPRYLCNDCHRPGYWRWWDGFDPYYSTCSVFDFRINAGWWWGPTYWTTYVPYYAYVFRDDCAPRYRSVGRGGWCSSWDGWRRWTSAWGGPLRRYKQAPPAGYVPPARWDRTGRGANRTLPPGFIASHERPVRTVLPGSGIRREPRDPRDPGSNRGGSRPWMRDTGRGAAGRETPPDRRFGRPDWGGRGSRAPWQPDGRQQARPERRGDYPGAQRPNRVDREERPRWEPQRSEPREAPAPRREPMRWERPSEVPAPPPARSRDENRGSYRQERRYERAPDPSPRQERRYDRAPDPSPRQERHYDRAPDPSPRQAPQPAPERMDRPQRNDDDRSGSTRWRRG